MQRPQKQKWSENVSGVYPEIEIICATVLEEQHMKIWPFTLQWIQLNTNELQRMLREWGTSVKEGNKQKTKMLSKTRPGKQVVGEWFLSTSVDRQKTPEKLGLLHMNFHNWLLRLGTWLLIQVSHLPNLPF